LEAKTIQKYKSKSVSSLIKIATRHFNKFIRLRDSDDDSFVCISCNQHKRLTQLHAGHFYPAHNNNSVRFDEDNVHSQCIKCNTYLHGNLANYKDNLFKKIGKERFQKLQQKVGHEKRYGNRWDRIALIQIIETYKEKNKYA